MQEDDLYKLATDELNSRNRKADLWARACALATDDVDEARYLYTNLRVEELALEHNVETGLAMDQSSPDAGSLDVEESGDVTSMEDLTASLHADDTNFSSGSGTTPAQVALARAEQKGSDTFSVFEAENSVDGTAAHPPLEDKLSSSDGELTLSLAPAGEEFFKDDPEDAELALGDLTKQAGNNHDNTIHIDAEMDKTQLQAAVAAEADPESGGSASAELLADLMVEPSEEAKQGGKPGSIAAALAATAAASGTAVAAAATTEKDAAEPNSIEDHNATVQLSESSADSTAAADADNGLQDDTDSVQVADEAIVAGSPAVAASGTLYSREEDLVEQDPENNPYGIYSDEEGVVTAVRQGGENRKAMLLTQVWFLSRGMWGMSLVYALMSLVLVVGLAILIPRCFANGATSADYLVTAGFVALALIGWFYLPYKFGNDWYELAIRKKGYNLQAVVDAHTPAAAEQEYYMQYFSNPAKNAS